MQQEQPHDYTQPPKEGVSNVPHEGDPESGKAPNNTTNQVGGGLQKWIPVLEFLFV